VCSPFSKGAADDNEACVFGRDKARTVLFISAVHMREDHAIVLCNSFVILSVYHNQPAPTFSKQLVGNFVREQRK
jgi:hypothetical protein